MVPSGPFHANPTHGRGRAGGLGSHDDRHHRLRRPPQLCRRPPGADRRRDPAGRVSAAVVPSGFAVLDDALEGGFRSGELVLLGGPQGLGKTTMVMQMIRNVVRSGGTAVIFSYEHEGHTLLERLLSLEAEPRRGPRRGAAAGDPRRVRAARARPGHTLEDRLADLRGVRGPADPAEVCRPPPHPRVDRCHDGPRRDPPDHLDAADRRRPAAARGRRLPPEGPGPERAAPRRSASRSSSSG